MSLSGLPQDKFANDRFVYFDIAISHALDNIATISRHLTIHSSMYFDIIILVS